MKDRKEYFVQYGKDNKEKISKYGKGWYQKNKEVINERHREHYQKNRIQRLAQLKILNQLPEIKERRRLNSIKWRDESREWLFEQLGGAKCVNCGYNTDKRALQFDHISGNGNKFRKTRRSYHSMMVYFKKNPNLTKQLLQVLCANCNVIKKFENNEVANR